MSTELPEGWTSVELSEHVYIAGRIGWRGLKAEEYTSSGPILLSVPNLNHGDVVSFANVNHISRIRYDESPEIQLQVGDTLLVKDGAGIGKLGFIAELPSAATVNSSLLVVRPNDDLLDPKYLFYFLKGPRLQEIALSRITGSATPHLFQKDIKRFRVLVPPVDEQRRIMERLDKLFAEFEQCKERMTKIPLLLKRFRQSVLAAACSGRLTANWRMQRRSASQDVNSSLDPDQLPGDWCRRRLDSMFEVKSGGTPSRKVKAYFENGTIPWVKTGEVQNCDIQKSEEFITEAAVNDSNAKVFPAGTILIAMYGEGKTRGQIGRLLFPAATNQACAALVNVDISPATNAYVFYYLLGQYYELRAESVGGNQPNLNLGVIKQWLIPLPSQEEQVEIVRRLAHLLAIADKIEARYVAVRRQVDRFPQSILAGALRGKLVPAEAEVAKREGRPYESAEELLERIRSQGTAPLLSGKKRRKGLARAN
jgi:type I restriction enzyme S subunit